MCAMSNVTAMKKVLIYVSHQASIARKNNLVLAPVASLRRKRFRGVWEQRKPEERDFRCFASAENGARTSPPFFTRSI